MNRLTVSDVCGNWQLKGLPWKDIHIGETITEPTRARLYWALYRLKDYEDTGLAPDEILSGMAAAGEEKLKVCDRCRNYGSRHYLCERCSRKGREDFYEPV